MRSADPMASTWSGRPSHVSAYLKSRVRSGAALASASRYAVISSGVEMASAVSCPTTCFKVGIRAS